MRKVTTVGKLFKINWLNAISGLIYKVKTKTVMKKNLLLLCCLAVFAHSGRAMLPAFQQPDARAVARVFMDQKNAELRKLVKRRPQGQARHPAKCGDKTGRGWAWIALICAILAALAFIFSPYSAANAALFVFCIIAYHIARKRGKITNHRGVVLIANLGLAILTLGLIIKALFLPDEH